MTRNSVKTPLGLLTVALLMAAGASASTLQLTDRQMVDASDLVIVGECLEMKSEWVGRNLMTRYTFKVDEVWAGQAAGLVEVVVPGGADANRKFPVATVWPGAPIFSPNERALLMLDQLPLLYEGAYSVVGFNQGRFTVAIGPLTAAKSSASTSGPALQRRESAELDRLHARFDQLIATKGDR
ncbi:MAG: hypothetical protein AAGA81_09790 [Acidobacteriota bacterium]